MYKRSNEIAYICENTNLTWNQVSIKVNQFAHWLLSKGIERSDSISLLMDNKPQFIIIWLACLAIDALPAFINYNLVEEGLTHCVTVSKAKILIYDSTYTTQISAATPLLLQALPSLQLVSWTDQFSTPTKSTTSITETTATSKFNDVITSNPSQLLSNSLISLNPSKLLLYPSTPIPNSRRSGLTWQSPAFLIFTSGSTGLPKTAICTHGRTKTGMIMYSRINGFNEHNRIYTPMPLYHSTAAILAIAVSWNCGAKVIIGRKFSATKFWFVFFSFLSFILFRSLLFSFAFILFSYRFSFISFPLSAHFDFSFSFYMTGMK